jgi:nitroreductase
MTDPSERLFAVMRAQRAHRALRPDPVPDATIERLLDAAVRAPSAENRQPWVFVVVRDPGLRARIADATRRLWETLARDVARARLPPRLWADVDRWATGGLGQAPVVIVVCGDGSILAGDALAASIFPATQNLLLAAEALGLGSLLSTLPTLGGDLAAVLGLPEHVRPMAVVPVGWPVRPLPPARRVPFRAKTFRDRHGQPW